MKQDFLNRCECVDFETSGLDPDEAEIVEQGVSVYNPVHSYWETVSSLHDCSVEIPPDASAVSNITSETVKGKPFFSLSNFLLTSEDSILISHNAPYDSGVVKKYLPPDMYEQLSSKWLCTLRMVRKLYANDASFSQFSLAYLRYRLKLPVIDGSGGSGPHRAGFDSYVTGLLLEYLIDELEAREIIKPDAEYLPQIKEWLAQPILIELMPFGKHEGTPIDKVPMSYLEWAVYNMDRLNEDSPEYDVDLATSIAISMDARL
jgi:DNA polymerase III epsilon subunit-like protein